jgi:hypothetical protein
VTTDDEDKVTRQSALTRAIQQAVSAEGWGSAMDSSDRGQVSQAWAAIALAMTPQACTCTKTLVARTTDAIEKYAALRARVNDVVRHLEQHPEDVDWMLGSLKHALEPWA